MGMSEGVRIGRGEVKFYDSAKTHKGEGKRLQHVRRSRTKERGEKMIRDRRIPFHQRYERGITSEQFRILVAPNRKLRVNTFRGDYGGNAET